MFQYIPFVDISILFSSNICSNLFYIDLRFMPREILLSIGFIKQLLYAFCEPHAEIANNL